MFSTYLLASIPIRDIKAFAVGNDKEIIEAGGWLGISITMDEFEEDSLTETPVLVAEAVEELISFEVEGRLKEERELEVAREFCRYDLFIESLMLTSNNYLKVRGWRWKGGKKVMEGLLEEEEERKGGDDEDDLLSFTIPLTLDVDSIIAGVKQAIYQQEPEWSGELRVARADNHQLHFQVDQASMLSTLTDGASIREFVMGWGNLHSLEMNASPAAVTSTPTSLTTFTATPAQQPSFILPFVEQQLSLIFEDKVMETITDLAVLKVAPERYTLVYRCPDPTNLELIDTALSSTLARLVSPEAQLRYYGAGGNALEPIFQALEDLVPAVNTLFVSPYDRVLQSYYSKIQGYEEASEEPMVRLLQRRTEFYQTQGIKRVVSLRIERMDRLDHILHLLSLYLSKIIENGDGISVNLDGDVLSIAGNILSIKDAISYYILLLQSSQEKECSFVRELRGGVQTASALVEGLSVLDGAEDGCAEEGGCLSEAPTSTGRTEKIILLSLAEVPSLSELRTWIHQRDEAASVIPFSYRKEGILLEGYSVRTVVQVTAEEIYSQLHSPYELEATPLTPFTISATDYQLDLTLIPEGDYYHCEAVETASQARFTIFYCPVIAVERVEQAWRQGRLITPWARSVYRVTGQLWFPICLPSLIVDLTPVAWDSLPDDGQRARLLQSILKAE